MEKKYILLNNMLMQKENNFYQLDKDLLAVEEFQKEVNEKLFKPEEEFESYSDRIYYLVQNNFYDSLLFECYSDTQLNEIAELIYSKKFKFQSFMAISKFYQSYALKTDDKKYYLETYEDRIIACALFLAQGDFSLAKEYALAMIEQRYQPATPTFSNAGKLRSGELVSCFLLSMGDSLNSINYNLSTCGQLSKLGGGVSVNLSQLRARNESIKGVEGAASGVLPVMKLMEDTFSYVNQLGQRQGAGVAYLNIFHWDLEEFLSTKQIAGDEKSRLQTLSIGLTVPDKFFDLARENKPFYVFAPHTVYLEYGETLDDLDIDKIYDDLVANPNVKKKELNARKILTNIAKLQFESGYPYLFFKTNANKEHALKSIGEIKITNLCTEIMQLQETSIINDYGVEDEIKRDISCNLGSLNITNVMESKSIAESVKTAMYALTDVSDICDITVAPGVQKANEELHSVGLGAMNLHGYLAKNKINYESEEAKDFVNTFFMMVNYYSLLASCEIATDRRKTFVGFKDSEYANGKYFTKYIENDYSPKYDKVKVLFDGMHIPNQEDWKKLCELVMKNGLYNAYRLTIAPTQSIGYVQNATPSIAPIVDLVERRTYGNSTTYYPMPYLTRKNRFFYKSAYNMDMYKLIDLVAVAQQHIDQGISTTLYVDSNTSTRELARYYIYAHQKGLKALYYTRTKNLAFAECETCSI